MCTTGLLLPQSLRIPQLATAVLGIVPRLLSSLDVRGEQFGLVESEKRDSVFICELARVACAVARVPVPRAPLQCDASDNCTYGCVRESKSNTATLLAVGDGDSLRGTRVSELACMHISQAPIHLMDAVSAPRWLDHSDKF